MRSILPKIVLTIFLIGMQASTFAARYYVQASATGNGIGTSWANAMTNLQEALSVVIPNDEIWVASGQYRPTATTDRTISFVLRDGVSIYGGFAGTETMLAQRDIAMNPTTLNGDIGALGETNDNSYSVVRANNVLSNIVLDGFRIINGNSNSTGGGLKIINAIGGSVLLKNCFVFGNQAYNYGGGIYMAGARLVIENCQFVNNDSSNGGAICNSYNSGGNSNLTIRDTEFKNNTAYSGACLYNTAQYNELIIDRCIFTNNSSPNTILDIDDFTSFRMLNSYVIGNTVNGFSSNVLFVNTFGSSGNGDAQMINCTIAHNFNIYVNTIQAEIIRFNDSEHIVSNCIIAGNSTYAGRQLRPGPVVSYSLIEGGYAAGTNIIDQGPLFTMPNVGATTNFDATPFDYTLQNSSPAINVGNNALINPIYDMDLALNTRIQGIAIDLGCYESSITTGTPGVRNVADPTCYFDAVNSEIRFMGHSTLLNKNYDVYDAAGHLCAQGRVTGNSIALGLRTGVHVLAVEGDPVLKFVVH